MIGLVKCGWMVLVVVVVVVVVGFSVYWLYGIFGLYDIILIVGGVVNDIKLFNFK